MNLNPEYIGQRLLERGFKTFFLYLFKIIEGRPFLVEPLHEELFSYFDDIYNGRITRCNINICPRSAKTTMSQYFLVFTLTNNPKSQIIYTSFSQSLLSEISSKVASILENPAYKMMFPNNRCSIEEEYTNPIDDFWREYLFNSSDKNTYSNRLIKTYAGGVCLFNSIGGAITGYGCSVKGSKKFSGYLCLDDPQKPADIRSQLMRDKTLRYFEETLLSRLNNSDTPIINVMQRLHVEDLSGLLEQKYNFKSLRIPLIKDNGECNLPSQYTKERIEELQKNNYVFQAQFQQEPILDGGNVIKTDWFKYYPVSSNFEYKKIIMVADTAMKVKEHNDYSVFMVGGISQDNKLHVLDVVRGKWEAPELKRKCKELWNKWQTGETFCSGLYVEDKASGTGLIQEIKTECSIPIIPIEADKDKLTRLESVLAHIEAGNVLLPESELYGFNPELLSECQEFTRDDSHRHDDQVDCLVYLIMNTIAKLTVSIYDVID
jgi:predicted phage terminase large subunit-like protein